LTIEGIKEFELLRDFLYSRMRGVKDHRAHSQTGAPAQTGDELTAVLREAVGELRAIREEVEKRSPRPEESRHV